MQLIANVFDSENRSFRFSNLTEFQEGYMVLLDIEVEVDSGTEEEHDVYYAVASKHGIVLDEGRIDLNYIEDVDSYFNELFAELEKVRG